LAQLFNPFNSVQAGQLELDQQQVRRLGGNSTQSRDAIALMLDIEALLFETTGKLLQPVADFLQPAGCAWP
jgi:hypothetical protein